MGNAIILTMISMVVIVVEMMSTLSTAMFVIALKWNQQPNHPWMNVKFHNGLVTTIVMMETTLLNVDLMEVIVVETMSTLSTAKFVIALKWNQQPNHPWMNVKFHNGLVTTIVMMETTILNVDLMEVIVAKKMQRSVGTTIVLNAPVWSSQRLLKPLKYVVLHNGSVMTI